MAAPGDAELDSQAGLFFSLFNGLILTYGPDWPDLFPPERVRSAALQLLGVLSDA